MWLLAEKGIEPLPFLIGAGVLVFVFLIVFLATRYKRCPANRILVIYGKGVGTQASKCIHGGGAFVWPIIQDYAYLSLEPITIDIDLTGALSKNNIRVNVPSTFTVGVSVEPTIMHAAAERILGLDIRQISTQTQDIIIGQLRLVIATLQIEEINKDREKFLTLINENVSTELRKIGLDVINVNIRDIQDESGYINAIGQKAAAEAINVAKVEVAVATRDGDTGEAKARREREVIVAQERARAIEGQKGAERDQRMAIAKLDAEGAANEAKSVRERDVAIAQQRAATEQGAKEADRTKRIAVSNYEAEAVTGENEARATIAQKNAALAEAEAEAKRRAEVARAQANQNILAAQRVEEQAKLEKEEIVRQEIDKRKMEIEAEAEAEKARRMARGEADAILARYNAEAEGIQRVLEAKAEGYRKLVAACMNRPEIAPTLLMIEKLPEIVEHQVKAISNLKIEKITVWDSGGNGTGGNTTANFLSGMIGSLPAVHELAKQAGIELPGFLGTVKASDAPQPVEVVAKPAKDSKV
ncbi:MAG: flotillin family protein [Planctomycetes bacterium]|nr:flotillin family protein [Planctomycetota bacterium]NUQ35095.1 flotillin family protein [Planctomycetaceae bacterium]